MDNHGNESTSRRSLFNGLVTVATRSWRHGQPNGHTSNAMVFPTITTAVNTSPTCRVPPTNSSTIAEEQSRRLQQQRHQDHRLNTLWYGGDDSHQHQQQQQTPALVFDSHNRFQSTDEWEKQPLRQQRQKSHHTRCRRKHKKKKHVLPTVPVIWAALLQAAYSIAMAIVYCIYNVTTGSGWIWLRGIADDSNGFYWWCNHLSPTWYYTAQASCAVVIGYFWYRWFCLRQQKRQQWCCFMLLVLFITALLPAIPLTEIFAGSSKTATTSLHQLENSTTKQQQKSTDYFKPENFDDNRLALYEGLWQVVFFIFVAYCLVLPTSVGGLQNNENDENTTNNRNNNTKNNENNINKDHITTAVLLFTIVASVGHTVINAFIAYHWCWKHHYHIDGLISSSSAIKQLIANIVVLTCINLIGWLLRRSLIKDRIEIQSLNDNGRLYRKHKQLRFALRRQAEKLNLLLASILPKRVFSEMKYDIVVDAARSYNVVFGSNNNKEVESHLKQTWQELQLQTPRLPRMYVKEYENVSVVCANLTGFWDNVLAVLCPGESGSQQSSKFITLIDRLLGDLFHKLARRNHCLPISILGHRMIFVAGLPPEEGYGYSDDEFKVVKENRHARNAIRLGLDLINSINVVVNDVSRYRYGHKINLNIRVGVHSGRITSGVLGFTGGTGLCFESGNRWQYEMWGPDVTIASEIESSGRSGWVHVSRTTVDQITKDVVSGNTLITGSNQPPPGVIFRQNTQNYSLDGYTFERGNSCNRIETYFVVPSKMCSNSMMSQNDVQNNDGTNNHFGEDIESLILQSVECQLEKEDSQQCIIDSAPEAEMTTEHLLSTSTTAVVEVPVMTTAMIPVAPVTSVKMIMNRHRRSRYYEQDPLQSVATKVNSNSALTKTMERFTRWEDNVFRGYDNDDNDKLRSKSDDDDLFRLAKSQLLLLCLIITLFVVNVTTMSWTMLLGITFITPFVVTAGELIYVMALLIDWIPRPRFLSTTYTASIIADDYEYYHHYDSDNNDSDCSISSDSSGGCFRRLLICHGPGSCSFLGLLLKPFRHESNTVTTTRRGPPEDNNSQCWFFSKWCRCYHCHGSHGWFTGCLDTDDTVSWISSEDSDIESRLGFRNENAIMAASVGASQPQQLLNRSQHSQPNNIRSSHRSSQFHRRQKRKYQVEGRRSWFFWLVACSEIFVVLLVCLLALLNAFTCEPVTITSTNTVFNNFDTRSNNSGGYKTSTLNNMPIQQQHLGPLICPWPQYVVLTCCLACLSIAVAFPIYYGSLPTMPMKIGTLLVMIFVFAIAFVHFTHRHVFNAASMLSLTQSCCSGGEDLSNRLTNNTIIMSKDNNRETRNIVRRDLYQENRQLLKLQDQKQQHAVDLDTLTTTVYVVVFAGALLAYFVYAHRLQNRRAHNKVKMDRDMRRLDVLRTAHRRTLHAIMPDHIAHSLQNSCDNNVNNVNSLCGRTLHRQNNVPSSIQPKLLTVNDPGREQIPAHVPLPLYHCGYRTIVVIFATIVQDPLLATTTSRGGLNEGSNYNCHRQLFQLHEIFSEFDKLLNNHRYRGLIEKIKMVGTNTLMVVVGLQHQLSSDSQLIMLLKDMKRRNDEFYHHNKQDKKYDVDSYISNGSVENDVANRYELQDIASANYIVFALDFIRDMRRVLHRWQTTTALVENSHNSQPMEFALRVGVNVGPAVAGLIGCKNGIWKRPLFDVWGNTVNVARQMDTTGVPGSTQVTDCVVNLIKALKDPKYEFDIRTKVTNKDNKRITYFVHEHFDTVDGHNLVEQQQNSSHLQKQTSIVHKNHHHQLELNRLPHNQPVTLRSSQNSQRSIKQHLKRDQSPSLTCNVAPIVTVHAQHSYFNAIVQQELRQKCMEPQKTPPPPPPRSPPSANIRLHAHPSVFQHQCSGERDQHPEQQQRSQAGIHLSHNSQQSNYQPIRRTPNSTTKTEVLYARPLQQQKHQQQNNTSLKSGSAPVPVGLSLIFGNDSQQPSSHYHHLSSITNVKSTSNPNHLITDETTKTTATSINRQQQQQPCRPNKLSLVNTTTSTSAVTSKNFDADRPLPAPPRSSDTVAGRQRHHHDPRRRRRQHNQSSSTTKQQQEQNQQQVSLDTNNGPSLVPGSAAWPSSSSFRSPISVGSFVSVSSPQSSLSSSESTDAGDTTTSNNNYNTTSTSSSSDESYGPTATEDCGEVNRVDTEGFDTAASSAAVSPIHHRYRQQQQLLLRQWSPSNSSSVKRSSSFRSPLSAGDASSSSLRSPLIAGHPNATGNGGTQSLNRRKIHSTHSTSGAGNSSGRRRRRRQQQLQNHVTASVGQSTPPSNVAPDEAVVKNTAVETTEKYMSPPSSPWKKPLQRRQVMSKDQGTAGNVTSPDFTDEIRRILLLDHHRDDINNGKQIGEDEVKQSLSSEQQQHRTVIAATTDWKSNKDDENQPLVVPTATKTDAIHMPSASSSFEERERQITEQVKRQEAEVRRILQAHKNNVVAVARGVTAAVQTDAALHSRRKRAPPPPKSTVESSEWSDDESVEPSSLLDDNDLQGQRISDYKVDGSVTTADEGDGYTTGGGDGYTTGGGDGDGYTTGGGDGYTTDDAVDAGIAEDMVVPDLSVISARQLDDNLSTMNDTGLTDAEGALSDVNSMIDYNDCDNRNRYGRRRQSSLSGSSVCPYASDSFCDDDDYLNDDDEFILHEGYDVNDEKLDVGNDEFGNSRQFNFNHLLQQQQQRLSPPQPSLSSLPDDVHTYNINKRLYSQQPQHQSSQYTAINTTQKLNMSDTMEAESARTTTSDNTSFSTETDITTKISKSDKPPPSQSSTINS